MENAKPTLVKMHRNCGGDLLKLVHSNQSASMFYCESLNILKLEADAQLYQILCAQVLVNLPLYVLSVFRLAAFKGS